MMDFENNCYERESGWKGKGERKKCWKESKVTIRMEDKEENWNWWKK